MSGVIRLSIAFTAAVWIAVLAPPTFAQLSPEETLARLKVADGLEVTLFAAEPDLWNPTTIDIDAQGRVWVCEAANYRLFNQPIAHKEGDRIRVLEDTDGDGRCDKATTFYQDKDLQAPMGIAVLGDRVYLCQAPDLFYLEDTDKDGVADKRTVILTGFEGVDHDHAVHGVSFGPDGLLYFSVGDRGLDVTDKSGNRVQVGKDRPHQAASVLRCDLEGEHLELLAEGMRNPYEPAVDPWGNVFTSDNDDDGNEQVRINFVIEGANYGYWPRRKGDRHLDEVHWNTDRPGVMPTMIKTGFGSPTGLMFYQGTVYDGGVLNMLKYKDTLIHADAGPRVIRCYRPTMSGAGMTAEMEILVSCDDDTWFRPSDVCAAPDGSIFISDWYDPGVGGHRMGDVTRGRIYRLAQMGAKLSVPAMDLDSSSGLHAALNSPNQARRFLAYTAVEKLVAAGNSTIERIGISEDVTANARAMWILAKYPNVTQKLFEYFDGNKATLAHVHAIRMLKRAGDIKGLIALATSVSEFERGQLAVQLASLNTDPDVANALIELAVQYNGVDRFYREAIGIGLRGREAWAFDEIVKRIGTKWDLRFAGLAIQLHPEQALPYAEAALAQKSGHTELKNLALDTLDAIGTKEAGERIVATLTSSVPIKVKSHALHLLARDEGDAWRSVTEEGALTSYLDEALKNPELRDGAWAFINDTRFVPVMPQMAALAADANASADMRVKALDTIRLLATHATRGQTSAYLKPVSALLEAADPQTRLAAVKALGAFRGDDAMDTLKGVLADAIGAPEMRREALHALAATKAGSNVLVEIAEKQELPQELTLDAIELLHSSPHENIRLMAEKVLPRASTREGQALPPLSEMLAMVGDPVRGKEVFFSPDRAQCYRCHVINGEGKLVGPDLSKIGQKASKENLYESILNPSAAVSPEYKVWIISSFEEGALSGFIRSETTDIVELMDSAGTTIPLKVSDILERTASSASLMPNGLTAALSATELADLVAYLLTLK